MDSTQLTLIISTLVSVLLQVAKRWLPATWLPIISLVTGAVASGAAQGVNGAEVEWATALQVLVGALLPTAIHAYGLKSTPVGSILRGKEK
ncbi:MAG: hypothetical protein Q8R28_11235 [Dehalococcoidia bacterium]|nr:hypothetical protein [Dehalococcoidia bacterium]